MKNNLIKKNKIIEIKTDEKNQSFYEIQGLKIYLDKEKKENDIYQTLKILFFLESISFIDMNDFLNGLNKEDLLLYYISQKKINPKELKEIFLNNYKNSIDFDFELKMNNYNLIKPTKSHIINITDGYFNIAIHKSNKTSMLDYRIIFSDNRTVLLASLFTIKNKDFINKENFYLLSLLFINLYIFLKNDTIENENYSYLINEAKNLNKKILQEV